MDSKLIDAQSYSDVIDACVIVDGAASSIFAQSADLSERAEAIEHKIERQLNDDAGFTENEEAVTLMVRKASTAHNQLNDIKDSAKKVKDEISQLYNELCSAISLICHKKSSDQQEGMNMLQRLRSDAAKESVAALKHSLTDSLSALEMLKTDLHCTYEAIADKSSKSYLIISDMIEQFDRSKIISLHNSVVIAESVIDLMNMQLEGNRRRVA